MKINSVQAVREIAKDTMGAHLMGGVIEKTRYLFDNMEVQHITDLLNDLIFYVSNPDYAEELDKKKATSLVCETFSLANMLVDLYAYYSDLKKHNKETGVVGDE